MAGKEERTLEIVARVKDQVSKTMRTMAATVKRLVKTGFLAPFKALGTALKSMKNAMLGFAGALASVFLIWRGGQWANTVIESADALNKLGEATGTSTESLGELHAAFEFAGLSAQNFKAIITGLGRGASAALNKVSSEQGDAFHRLGVSLELLKRGDAVAIFSQIAKGLEQYNTQAEKAAALQALFPDNFQKLLPLLGQSQAAFLANVSAARAFGAGLNQGLATVASETADELLKLNIALNNIARHGVLNLAREMKPVLVGMTEFLRLNKEGLANALTAAIRLLAEAMLMLGKAILWLAANLPQARQQLRAWLAEIPLIGPKMQEAFDAITGADGLDGVRQKMVETATELVRLENVIKSGADGEAQALRDAKMRVEELRKELSELNAEINKAKGLGGDTSEQEQALARARLNRTLANLPSDISGFAGLGGTSPQIARDAGVDQVDPETKVLALQSRLGEFWSSFKDGARKAIQTWTNFAQAGKQAGETVINSVGEGMTNAFTDIIMGTKKASDAFKDMARSILTDIARIISKMIAMQIIQAAGSSIGSFFAEGGAIRGAVRSTVPFRALAKGGVVDRPTLAMIGEGGGSGEAFVPLQSGRIPVRIQNAEASAPNLTFVIKALDGADVVRVLTEQRSHISMLVRNAISSEKEMRDMIKGASR